MGGIVAFIVGAAGLAAGAFGCWLFAMMVYHLSRLHVFGKR